MALLCKCWSVCVSLGGDEVSAVCPAAAVESNTDSKQGGAGPADTKRAVPGQRFSCFTGFGKLVTFYFFKR